MRPLVTNRPVALLGLAGLAGIALLMLQGAVDLVGAAQRAAVLLGLVLVLERLVLPVARALVGAPAHAEVEPEPAVVFDAREG